MPEGASRLRLCDNNAMAKEKKNTWYRSYERSGQHGWPVAQFVPFDELPRDWQLLFCPICVWGALRAHPEADKLAFHGFRKCGLCGFTCSPKQLRGLRS